MGLGRADWCKKEVDLIDNRGTIVAKAYVEFAKEWQSIDGRASLGEEYVGVVVCEVIERGTSLITRTLQKWPIKKTLYEGVSLYNQERQYNENVQVHAGSHNRRGSRQYCSQRHPRLPLQTKQKEKLLNKLGIEQTLKSSCCKRQCLSQFTHDLVKILRYEMHHSDTKSKDSIRLAVHRNSHYLPGTKKQVCVLEGKVVCMSAWRMIYGVSKTDFYRYRAYAESGRRPQHHGGLGRKKTSSSIAQATQTMSMILTTRADSMPHRTRTKSSGVLKGKKVVEKILPVGTKWRTILEEVNKV